MLVGVLQKARCSPHAQTFVVRGEWGPEAANLGLEATASYTSRKKMTRVGRGKQLRTFGSKIRMYLPHGLRKKSHHFEA